MVVCDRYLASSIAYGEAQGVDAAWLTEIQRLLPQPSLTILLDIPPDASLKRKKAARDKFERDLPLLGRVRESYLRQAAAAGLDSPRRRARQGRRVRRRCSAPCVHDSGCCKRPHFSHPASLQDCRARLECCSGRRDVVDQHDDAGTGIREPGSRQPRTLLHIRAGALPSAARSASA